MVAKFWSKEDSMRKYKENNQMSGVMNTIEQMKLSQTVRLKLPMTISDRC